MSNRPPLHPDWAAERDETRHMENWRKKILDGLDAFLGPNGDWSDKIGSAIHETQIQKNSPVNASFSFNDLDLKWVQFNTWAPNTKKPSHHVVRFGPDVGVLMVLVKVPQTDGSFKWLYLARRKYQFAAKDLFFENARGWIPGSTHENRGWKLLARDYPGILGSPKVAEIKEHKMGSAIWENNAQHSNLVTHHLIVVTLKETIAREDLQKELFAKRLEFEYPDKTGIDPKYLTVAPIVFDLETAADYLNSHIEGRDEKLAFFGEDYSVNAWTRFIARWGWQFPEICPEKGEEL